MFGAVRVRDCDGRSDPSQQHPFRSKREAFSEGLGAVRVIDGDYLGGLGERFSFSLVCDISNGTCGPFGDVGRAVAVGVINSYYWARLHAELGDKGTHSAIYHFANGDVGGLINVSGAAILKTSKNPEAAQKFLAYLVSERAQTLIASNKVTFEYPLHAGVAPDPILKPFDQLSPPAIDMQKLGDDSEVAKLLRQAGLL